MMSIIAGAAPMDRQALAVKFVTTLFVMHWISGDSARRRSSSMALTEAVISWTSLREY